MIYVKIENLRLIIRCIIIMHLISYQRIKRLRDENENYLPLFQQLWENMIPIILNGRPGFYSEIIYIAHVVVKSFHKVVRNSINNSYIICQSFDKVFFIINVPKFTDQELNKLNQ